jgi:hypothetical protein
MSPSSDDHMTPQERPEQGKFSKEERAFLSTHLPAYQALCHQLAGKATGPKGKVPIKGLKKDWVLKNVFPTFFKRSEWRSTASVFASRKLSIVVQSCC